MAESSAEIIARQLRNGIPLSKMAVAELRKEEQEGALRANASNIVRCMITGKKLRLWEINEAEQFFPEKVRDYKKALGIAIGDRVAPPSTSAHLDSGGMPLGDTRDERFALLVAKGMTPADALLETQDRARGWKKSNVESYAGKMVHRPEIAKRIAEIQARSANCAIMEAQEFRNRLAMKFRMLDDAGDIDGMVKVGTLLAKVVPDFTAPTKVELRDGGVTEDYREPHAISKMSNEEILDALTRDRHTVVDADFSMKGSPEKGLDGGTNTEGDGARALEAPGEDTLS